jgi:hypothetical protein
MIELINVTSELTLERYMASLGLAHFVEQSGFDAGDFKVYGCGMFRPGESYDAFVDAYSHGEMLGIIGLTIEESTLSLHEGSLRQLLGQILMRAPKIFMTDFQSAEWAPHYDIQGASHGGHPAWLCPPHQVLNAWDNTYPMPINIDDQVELIHKCSDKSGFVIYEPGEDPERKRLGIIAKDLGGCIAGAVLEWPTILMPDVIGDSRDAAPGGMKRIMNHPMIRFATRFNLTQNVATDGAQLESLLKALSKGELAMPDPRLVEAAKIEAYATIEKLLPQPAPADDASQIDDALAVFGTAAQDDALAVFGTATQERVVDPQGGGAPTEAFSWGAPEEPAHNMPKVIKPGDPFDPSTHYGEFYYSPGPGMVYIASDGSKTRYNGPGRDWEGFDVVADILRMITKPDVDCPTMVSLGCGFGYDVLRFRKKGWDAWGCDISKWSVAQAPHSIRHKIVLGNICDKRIQGMLPRTPHLVCTFDFWEHIFEKDIDQLLADLAAWMPKGGFMANIICTTGRSEKDITINPEDGFTLENSWFLISGHVTGRRWHWWANRFHEHGLKPRLDLCHLFQVARTEDSALSQAMSWRPRNLLIVERA